MLRFFSTRKAPQKTSSYSNSYSSFSSSCKNYYLSSSNRKKTLLVAATTTTAAFFTFAAVTATLYSSCYSMSSSTSTSSSSSLCNNRYRLAGFHGVAKHSQFPSLLVESADDQNEKKQDDERRQIQKLNLEKFGESQKKQIQTFQSGELGNDGIYLSTEPNAALLYGAAQVDFDMMKDEKDGVVLYRVYYDTVGDGAGSGGAGESNYNKKNNNNDKEEKQKEEDLFFWSEPPTVVPAKQTFEKLDKSLEKPPHDVLIVQHDGNGLKNTEKYDVNPKKQERGYFASLLPSQYKVNKHRLRDLRFVVDMELQSASDAFDKADEIISATKKKDNESNNNNNKNVSDSKPLPIVRVAPNGDCLFSSLAWHIKMSSKERGEFLARHNQFLASNSGSSLLFGSAGGMRGGRATSGSTLFFGSSQEERRKVVELKTEIANYIQNQNLLANTVSYRKKMNSNSSSSSFNEKWDLITNFGQDSVFLGNVRTLDEYLSLLSSNISVHRGHPVFCDIQLISDAVFALYGNRAIIVHTDDKIGKEASKPLVFLPRENNDDDDKKSSSSSSSPSSFMSNNQYHHPIEIHFKFAQYHYNAVAWRGVFGNSKL